VPGLTVTDQPRLDADVRVEEPEVAPSRLWTQLATPSSTSDLPDLLGRALREVIEEQSITSWARLSEEAEVDALDGTYASLAMDAARGDDLDWHRWLRLTRQLGGQTSLDLRSGLDDILSGPVALLDAVDVVPTVEIQLGREFFDHKRNQRERFLRFVTDLTRGFDVRITASGPVTRRLLNDHERDLPASAVNEAAKSRRQYVGGVNHPVDDAEDALDALGWDHPAWDVLRVVADTDAERAPYSALYDDIRLDVGNSTIRKRVQRLREHDLVDTFRVNGETHVALLPAGVEAVDQDVLDVDADPAAAAGPAERARETRATGSDGADGGADAVGPTANSSPSAPKTAGGDGDVSDPPNSSAGAVLTRTRTGTPPSRDDRPAGEGRSTAEDGAVRDDPTVEWLSLDQHHAAAAAAPSGGIALCDRPVAERDDPRSWSASYDEDRDEIVVSVAWDPDVAKTAVRLCAALLDDRLINTVLTTDRLNGGPDRDDLGGLVENNPIVLRDARCLGYLKDADASGNAYRERLRKARQELLSLTPDLSGSGGLNVGLASDVLREAHGLMGTVMQLYDLLGVDVVRQVEFPEFSRNTASHSHAVARFIAKGTSISSRYGHYSAERVLFEDRAKKREDLLGTPDVDTMDPHGETIGSWSLVGPGISRLADDLEEAFVRAGDVQDDAEHFAAFLVDVDVVQGWRREAVAEVLSRLGRLKRLDATRRTTSILHGLLGSVYDVARAIYSLGAETQNGRRDLDPAELRYALSQLPTDRVLPDADPAVSKIVAALLRCDRAVSAAELADRADASTQSVRNHRETLEAVGLLDVDETEAGKANAYRLRLPFKSERRSDDAPLPEFIVDDEDAVDTSLDEAVFELLLDLNDVDVDGAVHEALSWPADLTPIVERWPWLRGWVDVLAGLLGLDSSGQGAGEWAGGPFRSAATIGCPPPRRQVTLDEAVGNG
jgi:hypothetical protein